MQSGRNMAGLLLAMMFTISNLTPAYAHQPINLTAANSSANKGPIIVDGKISFVIRANFTKPNQTQGFRAALQAGETLYFEYLIIDKAPENKLAKNKLPVATITYPSGKQVVVKLNERTTFFEPYSRTTYLYLGRFTETAEAGIYKISIKSKSAAKITVAIGQQEIRGEVLFAATCPTSRVAGDISIGEAATLVGMSKSAASECAAKLNWQFRIGAEDDQQFALTKDYRLDRVTVTIKNNLITQSLPG